VVNATIAATAWRGHTDRTPTRRGVAGCAIVLAMVGRTRSFIAATWLIFGTSACGASSSGRAPPAKHGVTAFMNALERENPRAAYELLSRNVRASLSFHEFARDWTADRAERTWQAARLGEALRGYPDVSERAAVSFSDGKSVVLEREGTTWRLESALISRVRAGRPHDAIRRFADGIRRNDLEMVLRTLTLRRREGLARQLSGFLAGIARNVDGKLEEIGSDRAEMRWDENGVRFRIVLRREDDDWRIDDIHIHPVPSIDGENTDPAATNDLIF
jgi:hypothetical protein